MAAMSSRIACENHLSHWFISFKQQTEIKRFIFKKKRYAGYCDSFADYGSTFKEASATKIIYVI